MSAFLLLPALQQALVTVAPTTACSPCRKGRNFVYVHIQPQHECVVTEGGGWAVDFIGRVEHIDEDLGLVLAELEKRRPPDAPAVSSWGSRKCVFPRFG